MAGILAQLQDSGIITARQAFAGKHFQSIRTAWIQAVQSSDKTAPEAQKQMRERIKRQHSAALKAMQTAQLKTDANLYAALQYVVIDGMRLPYMDAATRELLDALSPWARADSRQIIRIGFEQNPLGQELPQDAQAEPMSAARLGADTEPMRRELRLGADTEPMRREPRLGADTEPFGGADEAASLRAEEKRRRNDANEIALGGADRLRPWQLV